MAEDSSTQSIVNECKTSNSKYNRRNFLQVTGLTLTGLALPGVSAASSTQTGDSVDPSDEDSVKEFIHLIDDSSKSEVKRIWSDINGKDAVDLSQAIRDLSYIEGGQATLTAKDINGEVISQKTGAPETMNASSTETVSTDEPDMVRSMNFSDQSIITQAQTYDYDDSVTRKTAGVTLYEMDASLSWVAPTASRAYPSSGSSSGSGQVPYWIDMKEITGTLSSPGLAQTTRERRYKHEPGTVLGKYTARMILQGSPAGSGVTTFKDPNN